MNGEHVCYQRRKVNLSRKGSDPDTLIWSLIRREMRELPADEEEFIVHSTSWRYERPGTVPLTYVAYSDELTFQKGKRKTLSLKRLEIIQRNSRKPRSKEQLERQVLSHAIRHIAFFSENR